MTTLLSRVRFPSNVYLPCVPASSVPSSRGEALTPKVAALIMVLLFLPVHYMLWAKFPIWYHPILFDYAGIHDAD